LTHPIEAESYSVLRTRIDLSHLEPGCRAVVERVIHASADLDYARSLALDESAVQAGVNALRAGATVLCDVEMVRAGVGPGPLTVCCLSEASGDGARTRSAEGMALAARRHPDGAVVVVGCAPTALDEVVSLAAAEGFRPALVIGLPVGFVGAAEAKARLRASGLPSISNAGEKGGSAVAAAALNALWRLARE
jgi:precorrin-8X/cobalt-precorrin-8 methylmutase